MADGQHDDRAGGGEAQRYPISGAVEATAFAALLLATAEKDRHTELITSSSAVKLARLIFSAPRLPAYSYFEQYVGQGIKKATEAPEPPVRIPAGQEGLYFGSVTCIMMRNIVLQLGGQRQDTQPHLTVEEAAGVVRKLSKVFKGGNLDVIGRQAQQAQHYHSRDVTDKVLPMGLLHAAALGMSYKAASDQPEATDAKLATALADGPLREACKRIRDGEKPTIDNTDATSILVSGALNALYSAYHLPSDKEFIYDAVTLLSPLFKDGHADGSLLLFKASFELSKDLITYGVDGASIDIEAALPTVATKLREAKKLASTRRTEYIKSVERLYGKFGMAFFARYLVDAIADGSIIYSEASEVAERTTNHPLNQRFVTVRAAREAEATRAAKAAAELAEEEARLQDLGWLSVQLNLDPKNEVNIEFLPSAAGVKDMQPQMETARQRAARERIAKIEEHRLLTLIRLQEIYPGSVLRFRTLKSKQADSSVVPRQRHQVDDSAAIDPMKVDGYLVLALPDGRAIGESLQPGNATIIFRPETWQGSVTWQQAFEFDKDYIKNFATVRIQHPDRRDLEKDYSGTVDSYVLLILEDLEWPLQPGEALPNLDILRNLRRALGGRATVGAQ